MNQIYVYNSGEDQVSLTQVEPDGRITEQEIVVNSKRGAILNLSRGVKLVVTQCEVVDAR